SERHENRREVGIAQRLREIHTPHDRSQDLAGRLYRRHVVVLITSGMTASLRGSTARHAILDAGAKSPGTANGRRLTQMTRGMEQSDPAQRHRPWSPDKGVDHSLSTRPERALRGGPLQGRLLHLSLPVHGAEAADGLARAAAHRVAIFAQGGQIELPRHLRDLGTRHADAEIAPGDAEFLHPPVVENLRPP